ncbi:hypothetical protein [Acetobacter pasteurianus]|nr:hypothetical protein [Acetobacter pasteurianus]GAB29838.1 hypothetical protein APS_0441 [Acetobacter pasteurianus subsp. pasteurianus LMG 1262 = NBRC 106471]
MVHENSGGGKACQIRPALLPQGAAEEKYVVATSAIRLLLADMATHQI